MSGTLYGISLGPGDPGLITRAAWAQLQRRDTVWVYPARSGKTPSYAFDIVARAGVAPPETHALLLFPMTHDGEKLARAWLRAADTVLPWLRAGRDVLFLVEGDASTYATFGHLARTVRALDATVPVQIVAGVNAFTAACAMVPVPFAEQDDTVAIVPAAYGVGAVDRLLAGLRHAGAHESETAAGRIDRLAGTARPVTRQPLHRTRRRAGRAALQRCRHPGAARHQGQLPVAADRETPAPHPRRTHQGLPQEERPDPDTPRPGDRMSTIPDTTPRICLVAITKHGAAQAARLAADLPQADVCTSAKFAATFGTVANAVRAYDGALRDEIGPLFAGYDQLVFFVSLGAVVRLIAPHLRSKDEDPGVIVVDDAGQYVIPVLSGHVGGANEWSERVADLLGAAPVLTTASDVGRTIPVDILGRHLGWRVEAPKINVTRVSAHVVNGEPIAFVQEAGSPDWWTRPTPLPATIQRFTRFDDVPLDRYAAVLWVTHAEVPAERSGTRCKERLVVYRPPQDGAA